MNENVKQAIDAARAALDTVEQAVAALDTPLVYVTDSATTSSTSSPLPVASVAPGAEASVETIEQPAAADTTGANLAQQDIVPPTVPSDSSETESESSPPSSTQSDSQLSEPQNVSSPEPPDTAGL